MHIPTRIYIYIYLCICMYIYIYVYTCIIWLYAVSNVFVKLALGVTPLHAEPMAVDALTEALNQLCLSRHLVIANVPMSFYRGTL